MKQYQFFKAFFQYAAMLLGLLLILFVSIILIFGFNVNQEINEMSEAQTKSVTKALNNHIEVNAGHDYFLVENNKITENHTPFTHDELEDKFVGKVKQPYVDESHKGIFDVRTVDLSKQKTLYSLTNVRDFHETKQFLTHELTIGFIFAFLLMIAMAYYLARRPIKVYQQLMAEQQVFIQNASHEMKTPIASLLLGTQFIEMADQAHLSEESKHTLKQMKTETKYMQQLIESMLQDTDTNGDIEPIVLSKVWDETINTVENVYDISIQKLYQPDLTYPMYPMHAKQMLNILLENAIVHNSKSVNIRVSAFKTVNGIQLEVSDNGKGIDESLHDKIFQRFYRGDQSQKGSGIGLSLLRNIVYQYGGTIEVKSKIGKGTTFIIKL